MKDFYKTKLTVEFEISTQFGPANAVNIIDNLTNHIPAIESIKVIDLKTDYIPMTEQDSQKNLTTLIILK